MSNKITDLVEEFARLEKARAAVKKEAKDAGLDPAALQRAATWNPANMMRRQVQAAVDHQVRHLAGRESKPAKIPAGSDLAKVAALYATGGSAREIGKQLSFGKTKANKLMQQAKLFGVRDSADADSSADAESAEPPANLQSADAMPTLLAGADRADALPAFLDRRGEATARVALKGKL